MDKFVFRINMDKFVFRIGQLKHKKLITLMQIIVALFTALIIAVIYSPPTTTDIIGIPKVAILTIGVVGAFYSIVLFSIVLTDLEKALGWDEKLDKKRWSLWGSKAKDRKFYKLIKKYRRTIIAFLFLEVLLFLWGFVFANVITLLFGFIGVLVACAWIVLLQFRL